MNSFSTHIQQEKRFKAQVFAWLQGHEVGCYLNSNGYLEDPYRQYEMLVGAGVEEDIYAHQDGHSFEQLKSFCSQKPSWQFGFLGYDLKNELEHLHSNHHDGIGFPDLYFFRPSIVVTLNAGIATIFTTHASPESIFQQIEATAPFSTKPQPQQLTITPRISKEKYLETVDRIRQHIIDGDFYEMNFCQEFYVENASIEPAQHFFRLNELSKAPFSAYFRLNDKYLMCASPERFIQHQGGVVRSQPIKGTSRRGVTETEDLALKKQLKNSKKNRAENVMIVDLVRNDFAKTCLPGSVQVEELFGIKKFQQVWQMVSTVRGVLKEGIHFVDAMRQAFPMGSMTGAPKVKCMETIELYEQTKRGLYSGSIGYLTPTGDGDFNVVIRSMLYNQTTKYLSFQVGGAIVYDSAPAEEYEECMVKSKAMKQVLEVF